MITFDGDRSLKRKWFAKKQIRVIKDIDVPGKAVKWEGFTFTAWQQGDLDGGRVTAPMGAVVCFSQGSPTEDGSPLINKISVAVSEVYYGPFISVVEPYSVYYAANGDEPYIKRFNSPDESTFIADGNSTYVFRPFSAFSPYYLEASMGLYAYTPESVYLRDLPGAPSVMPYGTGECFWLTLNDNIFIDLNNNGAADFPKYTLDHSLWAYASNGQHINKRKTVSLQVGGGTPMASMPIRWQIAQYLDHQWISVHNFGSYDVTELPNMQKICVTNLGPPTQPVQRILLEDILTSDMPYELRQILLDSSGYISCAPLGQYTFGEHENVEGEDVLVQTIVHGVNAANMGYAMTFDSPSKEYFNAHREEGHWQLFYVFYRGGRAYNISSLQFIELLDELADSEILRPDNPVEPIYYENAYRMLDQLFCLPNHKFSNPYDSIMFHAHDGNVYTWTRKYGAVKFTPTGLFRVTVIVPRDVSEITGVRPEITHGGDGLYLCVCNKVQDRILSVHYGSPFGGWTKLPGPPDGYTIAHVRPVVVTSEAIFLIGVIWGPVIVNGATESKYFFATLTWSSEKATPWQRLGMLPFEVSIYNNMSVGLYGNDPRVVALAKHPSPPAILPQTPVGYYDSYAQILP